LAFLGPILSSGTVSVWIPTELKQKMECFQPILSAAAQQGIVMTPYLRFDKDKEGRDIPEDLRVMVEPRRKPNDFVGIQFQVTFNNGPNGKVPYMYAVCITRGGGPTFHRVSQLSAAGFVVEHKQPGEYGSVVIRQETYADGYETKAGRHTPPLGRLLASPGPALSPEPAPCIPNSADPLPLACYDPASS
jgi:hypothetical protein